MTMLTRARNLRGPVPRESSLLNLQSYNVVCSLWSPLYRSVFC